VSSSEWIGETALGGSTVPSNAFLRAQWRVPSLTPFHVERPRLFELLDELAHAPLTLVVAPPGSGKTTLASAWVERSDVPTAWLTLDAVHDDPALLWRSLVGALEKIADGCGDGALAALRRHEPSTAIAESLLAQLDREPDVERRLVIDNLDALDQPDQTLGLVLGGLPSWLHVVILSRRGPERSWVHHGGHGVVGEIGLAELRFSSDEARVLLQRLAPELTEPELDDTYARTEGWAVGLQLAGLAARGDGDPSRVRSPLGAEARLHDYVLLDALGSDTADVRDVLIETSVVEYLDDDLAAALTGRAEAGAMLRLAESRNLFVSRVGKKNFRVHPLVREVCEDELERRSTTHVREQHVIAARWFEEQRDVATALRHLLLADRQRDALRVLAAASSDLYDNGGEATIRDVLAQIDPELAVSGLDEMVQFAWCHLLVDRTRFLQLVEEVAWWAHRSPQTDRATAARVTMIRAVGAQVAARWGSSRRLARDGLREFGPGWVDDPLGRFGQNLLARAAAFSERWDDDHEEIRTVRLGLSRDPQRRLSLEGTRALGHALAGRPTDALLAAAGVRHAADVTNMSILRVELRLAEALAHRELGDRERAIAELELLAGQPTEAMRMCQVQAMLALVDARREAGDIAGATIALKEARAGVEADFSSVDMNDLLAIPTAQLAVSTGALDRAAAVARGVADPFWGPVSRARVDLAAGRRREAVAQIAAAAPRCPRHRVVRGVLAAQAAETEEQGASFLRAAAEEAARHGMVQTLLAEGGDGLALIERSAWALPEEWLGRLRRAAAELTRGEEGRTVGLAEPLTPREWEVLRYLPTRLTVREIADELFISMNTLKFHLKVIYRKLDVHSRAEATEVARSLSEIE
jgi:LuxR family maltose regulon positive regulatory protein